MESELKGSVVTITGGTGSFGSTMASELLMLGVAEVRILSRDENKQDIMRNKMRDNRLKFYIGDVRDAKSIKDALRETDYVFHAAALKQVPSCEFFPMQAVSTNLIGSSNVLNEAFDAKVKSIVCLSTDKAVYPINAMGMTKALMEKVAQAYARSHPHSTTKVSVTRYGNVMMSRGSVIPLFIEQIRNGSPVTVTDLTMTRFLMSLKDSVELVKFAFVNSNSGDLFVKKAPACTIENLVKGIAILESKTEELRIREIGVRHGEKHSESLLGSEERARSKDLGHFFQVPLDSRDLDYQIYFDKGHSAETNISAYTSSNAEQLTAEQVAELIGNLPEYSSLERK